MCLRPGGSAGIGLSTAKLLLKKGVTVHVIDVKNPDEEKSTMAASWQEWSNFHVHLADVRDWQLLQATFAKIGRVDLVFANAGTTESDGLLSFLGRETSPDGELMEPKYEGMDVNIRGVFNTVKLAYHSMKKNSVSGSIVITGSTAMYIPDEYVPLGSAAWGAVSFVFSHGIRSSHALDDN